MALDLIRQGPKDDAGFRLLKAAVLLDRYGSDPSALLTEPVPPEWEARRLRLMGQLERAQVVALRHSPDELFWIDRKRAEVGRDMGDLDCAASDAESALRHAERIGDAGLRVRALVEQYLVAIRRLRYGEALVLGARAVEISESNAQKVRTLQNLADLHSRLGEFEESAAHLKKAAQLAVGPEMSGRRATLALIRGNIKFQSRQREGAVAAYREALAEPDSPKTTKTSALLNLAAALIQLGKFAEARDVLNHVELARRNQIGLYQGEIALGERDPRAALGRFLRVAADGPLPSEKWEALYGRARAYAALKDPGNADAYYEKASGAIDESFKVVEEEEIGITLFAQLMDFHHNYVTSLYERGHFERALAAADASRARVLRTRLGSRAAGDIRATHDFKEAARRANACTLSYWLGDTESYGWLVTTRDVFSRRLPRRKTVDENARRYRDAIEGEHKKDPLKTRDESGRWLFDNLVGPFLRDLSGCQRVFVVPDGELHRLNFDTLPAGAGDDRHYWIEDVVIAIAASAGGLEQSREPAAISALLVGDAAPLATGLSDAENYPPPASAPAEMAAIRASLPRARTRELRGTEAVPSSYAKSEPGAYAVVHFSAHAVANELRPLESAIILAAGPTGHRLLARDVAQVGIRGTELVTLSACHSAGARSYSGEGLVGFAWAFLGAGARHVVAGLWDVTDNAMPDFMADFYRGIGAGKPVPDSLRDAKLALMKKSPRPYYWAPMQAFVR